MADLQGKPLVYHVYRRASHATTLKHVLIATDDERVVVAARRFGAEVVLTKKEHRSGTDRVAEAAQKVDADVIVNIQGDEPLIDPGAIDHVVNMLGRDHDAEMSTLKAFIQEPDDLWNPNIVKVVSDQRGYAVYFSRAPIPYARVKELANSELREILESKPELLRQYYRHIGLYAYRRDSLMRFTEWAPSHLEMLEDLEQLRAIEHGIKIRVEVTHASMMGIDTPEDMERIRKLVANNPRLLQA